MHRLFSKKKPKKGDAGIELTEVHTGAPVATQAATHAAEMNRHSVPAPSKSDQHLSPRLREALANGGAYSIAGETKAKDTTASSTDAADHAESPPAPSNTTGPMTGVKPLMVATSGGRGHISTILGLNAFFDSQGATLVDYGPAENDQHRPYLDILLDLVSGGETSVKMWNTFQRRDWGKLLNLCVTVQPQFDKVTNRQVSAGILRLLMSEVRVPFSKVVCAQPLNLLGILQAADGYNKASDEDLKVELYITDIICDACVHYLDALKAIPDEYRHLLKLHGITAKGFQWPDELKNIAFQAIDPANNPMLREAFRMTDELKGLREKVCKIHYAINSFSFSEIQLQPETRVASIMLGGQGGEATFDYVEELVKSGEHDVIIAFCGQNDELKQRLVALANSHQGATKIYALGNQDDKVIAKVLARTNAHVTRSGGLSVMEIMALVLFLIDQRVYIHNGKNGDIGIKWEKGNGEALIDYLAGFDVFCQWINQQIREELASTRGSDTDISAPNSRRNSPR